MGLMLGKTFENGTLTYVLQGRLDTTTSPLLEEELMRDTADGVTEIVFDAGKVEYVSSAGLRIFFLAVKLTGGMPASVHVLHPSEMVREVLEMTGLTDFMLMV